MARVRPALILSLFLATLAATPLHAGTFSESFDDGAIDPSLTPHPISGFAIAVDNQALELTKADGTGNGEAVLRSNFLLGGDFSAATEVTRVDLSGAAELGIRAVFQGGKIAEIFLAGADTLKATIDASTTSETQTAASATLRIRRSGNDLFCEIDTGTGFTTKNSTTNLQLGKARVRLEWFLRQSGGSSAAHTGRIDDLAVSADVIQGGGGGGPTATPTGATGPTPTPRPSPATLDHFMSYGVKTSKGTLPFVPLGPVTLPRLAGGSYDVLKVGALLLPADKNGEGVHDDATHLLEYKLKVSKDVPKFPPLSNVRVLNQCNDVFIQITKPVAVLVPTAKNLANPVPAPVGPGVDHFLCYQAKSQKKGPGGAALPKFPKGIQVDVADQFQIRRYELTKVSKLCLPTAKSGAPVFLKGPDKGQPAPLAPASVQHANEHLVCYKAKLASTRIEQLGCGPASPGDKGTKIAPKQPKHVPNLGVFIANQLGALRLDTTKEIEFCVPSFVELPIA